MLGVVNLGTLIIEDVVGESKEREYFHGRGEITLNNECTKIEQTLNFGLQMSKI